MGLLPNRFKKGNPNQKEVGRGKTVDLASLVILGACSRKTKTAKTEKKEEAVVTLAEIGGELRDLVVKRTEMRREPEEQREKAKIARKGSQACLRGPVMPAAVLGSGGDRGR